MTELDNFAEVDSDALLIEAYAKLAEARAALLGEPLLGSDIANTMREAECCGGCGLPFLPGDLVYGDYDGGHLHEACCGSEPEGFIGGDGQPLKPGEPIPEPHEWHWEPTSIPNPTS